MIGGGSGRRAPLAVCLLGTLWLAAPAFAQSNPTPPKPAPEKPATDKSAPPKPTPPPAPPGKADRIAAHEFTERSAKAYKIAREKLKDAYCSGDKKALAIPKGRSISVPEGDWIETSYVLEVAMRDEVEKDREVYALHEDSNAKEKALERLLKTPSANESDVQSAREAAKQAGKKYIDAQMAKRRAIEDVLKNTGVDFSRPQPTCPPPTDEAKPPPKPAPPAPAPDKKIQSSLPGPLTPNCTAAVVAEINLARADPAAYVRTWDELTRKRFDDAVTFLERQPPAPALTADSLLGAAAARHLVDLERGGPVGHTGSDGSSPRDRIQAAGLWSSMIAEDISLGQNSAQAIVRQWIVDKGVPGAPHRSDMFNPLFLYAGAACGPHKDVHEICVLDLSGTIMRRAPPEDHWPHPGP